MDLGMSFSLWIGNHIGAQVLNVDNYPTAAGIKSLSLIFFDKDILAGE